MLVLYAFLLSICGHVQGATMDQNGKQTNPKSAVDGTVLGEPETFWVKIWAKNELKDGYNYKSMQERWNDLSFTQQQNVLKTYRNWWPTLTDKQRDDLKKSVNIPGKQPSEPAAMFWQSRYWSVLYREHPSQFWMWIVLMILGLLLLLFLCMWVAKSSRKQKAAEDTACIAEQGLLNNEAKNDYSGPYTPRSPREDLPIVMPKAESPKVATPVNAETQYSAPASPCGTPAAVSPKEVTQVETPVCSPLPSRVKGNAYQLEEDQGLPVDCTSPHAGSPVNYGATPRGLFSPALAPAVINIIDDRAPPEMPEPACINIIDERPYEVYPAQPAVVNIIDDRAYPQPREPAIVNIIDNRAQPEPNPPTIVNVLDSRTGQQHAVPVEDGQKLNLIVKPLKKAPAPAPMTPPLVGSAPPAFIPAPSGPTSVRVTNMMTQEPTDGPIVFSGTSSPNPFGDLPGPIPPPMGSVPPPMGNFPKAVADPSTTPAEHPFDMDEKTFRDHISKP